MLSFGFASSYRIASSAAGRDCAQPSALDRVQAAWAVWTDRCERRRDALAIDRRTLADIGVARGQVILESAKPFWRP